MLRISEPVRGSDPHEPVRRKAAGGPDCGKLRILAEAARHLEVAGRD